MRKITITDGVDTITLLADLEFTWTPKIIGERATMASGKTVMDVTGIKNYAEIPTGWLSPADLATLKRMITQNVALTVSYPTVDGDRSDVCYIEMPEFKAFKYGANGVEQWYGVTLKIEQQGVDPVS